MLDGELGNMLQVKETATAKGYPVYGVFGPTAVGKTSLSFYLSEKLSASILNCDSISMYKGLDMGSAKPVKEIHQAQHPLFLFDEWEPPYICTAGVFRKKALSILEQELSQRSVIAVGGSGFYIQALEKGMYPVKPVPENIKTKVQNFHQEKGTKALYEWLKDLDPLYAKQIADKDIYRISRALCIILSEDKPLSLIRADFKEQTLPYPYIKVGLYLPRDLLLKKVQIRTEKMIKAGLLEEVKALLDRGLEKWPILNSVGYKEAVSCLQNKINQEELKNRIVHRTMRMAKKQMSWFKRDKNMHWYVSHKTNWSKIDNLFSRFQSYRL